MIPRSRSGIFYLLALLLTGLMLWTTVGAQTNENMFGEGDSEEPTTESLAKAASIFSTTAAEPGKTYPAAVVIDMKPGWHINSATPYQDWLIPVQVAFDTVKGLTPGNIVYPAGSDNFMAGETMSVLGGQVIIFYQIKVDDDAPDGGIMLPVSVTYQPCNDNECRPPVTSEIDLLVEVGSGGQPLAGDIFATASFPDNQAAPATGETGEESDLQQLIDKYGFWGYFMALGLAFITGLLLSFSPCTYPMIPITVSIFAGQDRSMGRGFVLSLFYVGAMAVVYGIMGLVVSLVGGVFGAWLASPPVVIGIAMIFVIFALSMFGLYDLNVPASLRQKLGGTKGGGGIVGSMILGVVAALVVSPCVGPFVAGILLYIATHGSPVVGFLILFVFALGLGTLFVIIGTFSSAITALPRAGEWMDSVRRFFGFVLLLMAIYFLRVIISPTLTAVLTGLLLMALGIFGGGLDRLTNESNFFQRLKKFVGVMALLFGIYFLMGTVVVNGLILPPVSQWLPRAAGGAVQENTHAIPWDTNLDAALARAKAEGKPVLIDTWATWCAVCRELERKTFSSPDIASEAGRFVPVRVQLETSGAPETKDFMNRFGWKTYSLPTILLLDSDGETAYTLRGMIGAKELLEKMRDVH